jgi:hypothetical protein
MQNAFDNICKGPASLKNGVFARILQIQGIEQYTSGQAGVQKCTVYAG